MEHLARHITSLVALGPISHLKTGIAIVTKAAVIAAAVTLAFAGSGTGVSAAGSQPYVVGNDRGGFVRDRLIEIRNLRNSGRRVEIRGNICYSTCTMLLGLPNTCISPNTKFGFHGPSNSGRRLSPEKFDFYSRVIAANYPEALSAWYMKTGRNRISGLHKIRGSEIIRMGVHVC